MNPDPASDPEELPFSGVQIDYYAPSENGSTSFHGAYATPITTDAIREAVRTELESAKAERKRKKQTQQEAYPRTAFEAFRKAFPDGPIRSGIAPTLQEVQQWSDNFLSALTTDEQSAENAAMEKVRPRLDPIEAEIAAIAAQKRKAYETAVNVELAAALQDFDKQASAADRMVIEGGGAVGNGASTAEERQELESRWRSNKVGEIDAQFAGVCAPLEARRQAILKEVDADLQNWRHRTAAFRKRHDKLRAEQLRLVQEEQLVQKAHEVKAAVIRTVSERAGSGPAADAAVVAASMGMSAMVKITRRKTLYAFLWKTFLVLVLLAAASGFVYAWKTRAIHALFRRGQIFRRQTTTVEGHELLSEPPRPDTDFDHFFWLRNTTGICRQVSKGAFAGNRMSLPWSDGTTVDVTLSAVSKWLSMYAGNSTCFCAAHLGLGLPAVRLYKDEEPYVLFNPAPVLSEVASAVCNPGVLNDDTLVQFSAAVRDQWVMEDDGPLPDWVHNPPFQFPKAGFFTFADWTGRQQKIYLDDGGAACYGYCSILCQ